MSLFSIGLSLVVLPDPAVEHRLREVQAVVIHRSRNLFFYLDVFSFYFLAIFSLAMYIYVYIYEETFCYSMMKI
jgi:hypothetical protein